ncbi:MAG: rhodanese-like domain-containing protein [Spirochaetales bacterium]
MKTSRILLGMLILTLFAGGGIFARDIPAVVDVAWLEANLNNPKLLVLDVRKVEDYRTGHVPGAVNSFYNSWAITKKDLAAELPEPDDLEDLIQLAGISKDSWVVVVESEGVSRFHFATRIAWTLAYAGLDNVAVLDVGQAGWVKAGKPVATDMVRKPKGNFKVSVRKNYLASIEDVKQAISSGTSILLDSRPYDNYFGRSKPAFVAQFGHIPGAYPTPSDWFYTAEGNFASKSNIQELFSALGLDQDKKYITYCNSGVYCSAVWWVLHEMLEYKNVSSYDGSAQEISKDPSVTFRKYVWR